LRESRSSLSTRALRSNLSLSLSLSLRETPRRCTRQLINNHRWHSSDNTCILKHNKPYLYVHRCAARSFAPIRDNFLTRRRDILIAKPTAKLTESQATLHRYISAKRKSLQLFQGFSELQHWHTLVARFSSKLLYTLGSSCRRNRARAMQGQPFFQSRSFDIDCGVAKASS